MEDIKSVWNRYRDGHATAEDLALLESWYLDFEETDRVSLSEEVVSNRLEQIARHLPLRKKSFILWPKIAITAAAVFVILFGLWLFNINSRPPSDEITGLATSKIRPGKNTATLTLPDGTVMSLSSTKTGIRISPSPTYNDGTTIGISGSAFSSKGHHLKSQPPLLTASTPRGGTYQLTLPDGSKIWLNAASTLKFPADFEDMSQRVVELSGEAYFEISRNEHQPFIVRSAGQQVKVLGTHFNINSYPDETAVHTTLLEGSVSISTPNGISKVLKPDQQSILEHGQVVVRNIDADYSIAWKNGYFIFNSERLESAMNKIARWYNVSVSYKDPSLKDETLLGTISRFDDIGKVLKVIGRTDVVGFEVKGNQIVINRKKS